MYEMKDLDADRGWFHIQHTPAFLSEPVSPLFPLVSSEEKTRGKQSQDGGDKWNWVQAVQAKDISITVSSTLSMSLFLSVSPFVS